MSGKGESLSSVIPDILLISRKNKIKKTSDISIIRKQPIQEPANQRKREKENTLNYSEKLSLKKHLHRFGIR